MGSPGSAVPGIPNELTGGEKRFADLERELEMLAVGARGGDLGNAEDLVKMLESQRGSGGKNALAALEEDDDSD